ncbi:COPIA protein, partial [Acromyrmex charruanus]
MFTHKENYPFRELLGALMYLMMYTRLDIAYAVQRSVTLSSTEAEYMSLTDAAKEGIHLSRFLREMGLESLANVQMFNQAAGKLTHNPVFYSKSKHIDVKFHFIQETLKRHPIKQEYLPTEFMVADILTKGLPHSRYEKLIEGLGVMETSSHRSD